MKLEFVFGYAKQGRHKTAVFSWLGFLYLGPLGFAFEFFPLRGSSVASTDIALRSKTGRLADVFVEFVDALELFTGGASLLLDGGNSHFWFR